MTLDIQSIAYNDGSRGAARKWPINEVLLTDYVMKSLHDGYIAELHGVQAIDVAELRNLLDV